MNSPNIHPTAVVDDDALIEEGASVWHFCHISRGARVGQGCTLGQNVFIGEGVRIGSRVKVQNNVSVYSGVELADDVFIGPSVVFTNVTRPRSWISQKARYQKTLVEKGATIGANATIVCGSRIGAYALIGAGSVVTKDVPPYAQVQGNPARQVGWVDESGKPVDAAPKSPSVHPPALPPLTDENAPILEELEKTATRILRDGRFISGPDVEAFESEAAAYLGSRHAISCSSATDALLMALAALEIGPGDEVITSPFSFFATVESIVRCGATPVFVDIDPHTYHLDVSQVQAALSERTKAVLAVHLFGQTQELSALRALLHDRGIHLIEDAAQAFGARENAERRVGAESDLCCFSFFPSKNLGGFGDGGLVTTHNKKIAERLDSLRKHGATRKNVHEYLGGNFRMDTLQAALLRVKLPHTDTLIARRKQNAQLLIELLSGFRLPPEQLTLPLPGATDHTYNQFVVRTPQQKALQEHLRAADIDAAIYYPKALHHQPALARFVPKDIELPHAEQAANTCLALPVYPALESRHIEHVASTIRRFFL
jgi:dTDP-4-amino-4,6-dideoxygalactose transaminase/acetyltransferase-like isoleucine patch superfamily enzyme